MTSSPLRISGDEEKQPLTSSSSSDSDREELDSLEPSSARILALSSRIKLVGVKFLNPWWRQQQNQQQQQQEAQEVDEECGHTPAKEVPTTTGATTTTAASCRVLTVPQVTYNLLNVIIGSGVLGVPYAFAEGGYATILVMALVLCVVTRTGRQLGSALDMAACLPEAEGVAPAAMDYGFLAEMAFGKWGRAVIRCVTTLQLSFSTVTFLVMCGANVQVIAPEVDMRLAVSATAVATVLLCLVPQREFSYLSLLSTSAMGVALLALLVAFGITCMPTANSSVTHTNIAQGHAVLHAWNLPRSMGIINVCFAGHPVFPSVHAGMKNTRKWDLAIDTSYLIAFVLCASFGLAGYLVFGTSVEPIITSNLAEVHRAVALPRVLAAGCFLVNFSLTLPMIVSALLVAVHPPASGARRWSSGRMCTLVGIISVAVTVALLVHDTLAVVMSLSGSLCIMVTSVLFPTCAHFALARRLGLTESLSTNCAYIIVIAHGVIFGFIGTSLALSDLFNKVQSM